MRIRQILQISSAASMASMLLVVAAIAFTYNLNAQDAAVAVTLDAVIRKISLIRGFLPEFASDSHRRATVQWQIQYQELTPAIHAIPALEPQTQALKARILKEHAAVGALFVHLSEIDQGSTSAEVLEIIGGQLDVRTASMVSDVLALNDLTSAFVQRQQQWASAAMAFAVAVLAAVIVCLLRLLYLRVVIPIVMLEQATALFGVGQLDHAIQISNSDEIGRLAASFEAMRVALRERMSELNAARSVIKEENEKLAQRVDERTAELRAANQELDSFAYAVSHDLRAPLRAMSGFSQALIEDYGEQLTGEARDYLNQINIGSLRMGELISGLLLLSRSTRAELRYADIDLSAMAERILAELARAEPQRMVACAVEPGLAVRGDAVMIEAVLRNLLDNAWKFTQRTAQPSIRVTAEKKDGESSICVTDNGAGFDMAHAAKLFQPFQRLHRQDEFTGNGIGLATVSRIIHRHGGKIIAEGAPGKGASFCFSLPHVGTKDVS